MIYIACALYCEAESLINLLNLKKDKEFNRVQVFSNENVTLFIAGVGVLASAISASDFFACIDCKNPITDWDIFVNIGVCGCAKYTENIGDIFICNKITDGTSGKTYYPDIIYRHTFKEGELVSFPHIIDKAFSEKAFLYDMEASGLYVSASRFFKVHNMFFIKIVSDYGVPEGVTPEKIKSLIAARSESICEWILKISKYGVKKDCIFTEEEKAYIEQNLAFFKLSETMKYEARQLYTYCKLKKGEFKETVTGFIEKNGIKVSSRKEGKVRFEELRRAIIE